MALFHSERAEQRWERNGAPYCEHPKFYRDGNDFGPDEVDYYCGNCGALWPNRAPERRPEPRGN